MSSRFLLHSSWRGCNQSQLSCIRIKRYNNLVLLIVIQYFKINKCRFKLKLDRKMVNVFSFLTANFSSNIHRWDTLFWQYSPVENYILCYGLHRYFNYTAWGFNMIHSNSWCRLVFTGMPQNQLGTLAGTKAYGCEGAYFYLRW